MSLVGSGPGDPDLLTVAGLRELQSADLVIADRLVSKEILGLVSFCILLVVVDVVVLLGRSSACFALPVTLQTSQQRRGGLQLVRYCPAYRPAPNPPKYFVRSLPQSLANTAAHFAVWTCRFKVQSTLSVLYTAKQSGRDAITGGCSVLLVYVHADKVFSVFRFVVHVWMWGGPALRR